MHGKFENNWFKKVYIWRFKKKDLGICSQPPSVSSINRILRTRAAERAAEELAIILNSQNNTTLNSVETSFFKKRISKKQKIDEEIPLQYNSTPDSMATLLAASLLFKNFSNSVGPNFSGMCKFLIKLLCL